MVGRGRTEDGDHRTEPESVDTSFSSGHDVCNVR